MSNVNRSRPKVSSSNPNGWPLGVQISAPKVGNLRVMRLSAKKADGGGYTAALDADGGHIRVRVENSAAAIGQAVIDIENGVHGIPVG